MGLIDTSVLEYRPECQSHGRYDGKAQCDRSGVHNEYLKGEILSVW